MVSLPQPCPQCAAPIMNYSAWCAECGYKPSAPKSPAYLAGYSAALKDAAKVAREFEEHDFACGRKIAALILRLSPVEPKK